MSSVWGTVPAWVGAISTSLALVGAVGTFWWTERNRVRGDASDVHLRVFRDAGDAALLTVRLTNRGTKPVYEVIALVVWVSKKQICGRMDFASFEEPNPVGDSNIWDQAVFNDGTGLLVPSSDLIALVQFRDTHGRTWARSETGSLVQVRWRDQWHQHGLPPVPRGRLRPLWPEPPQLDGMRRSRFRLIRRAP